MTYPYNIEILIGAGDPEILNPDVPWNNATDNTVSLTVNGSLIVRKTLPGISGIEDVSRGMYQLAEWGTPLIHKKLSPGGL